LEQNEKKSFANLLRANKTKQNREIEKTEREMKKTDRKKNFFHRKLKLMLVCI
jgi:hypothetical protein